MCDGSGSVQRTNYPRGYVRRLDVLGQRFIVGLFTGEGKLISRRKFLGKAVATGVGTVAVRSAHAANDGLSSNRKSSFVDLLREPDLVNAFSGMDEGIRLERSGKEFGGRGILVETQKSESELQITLSSPRVSLTHLHLRWRASVDAAGLFWRRVGTQLWGSGLARNGTGTSDAVVLRDERWRASACVRREDGHGCALLLAG